MASRAMKSTKFMSMESIGKAIARLYRIAMDEEEATPQQVTALRIYIGKSVPDLKAVEQTIIEGPKLSPEQKQAQLEIELANRGIPSPWADHTTH